MSPNPEFAIGRQVVGLDHPTYFIADIAANHDGSLDRAVELIHSCAASGANAAKFQNFTAETIVSDYGFTQLGKVSHQAGWKKSVTEVYADASLPPSWTERLRDECTAAGIDYFTAPYDLDLIEQLSSYVCAWKVGSGDVTWHESIERMARDGKPVLIATGASDMYEVHLAVAAARQHTDHVVVMQCNTNYTADIENFRYIALNVLPTFAAQFPDLVLGLSDHTPGHATVLGAVALGARVIEKHYTDDVSRDGPDHKFSMSPASWREMVDRTRELELALGERTKRVMDNERDTVVVQRRAVRARERIAAGTVVGRDRLTVLRPCPSDALPPYRLGELLGRVAVRDIEAGDCVRIDDVK